MVSPRVIIAGFGIPGRYIAELLDYHGVPYSVIELNPSTIKRCTHVQMILGDVREESVLRQAGIEHAVLLAITVPVEETVLQAIAVARRVRPGLRIFARMNYTSSGLKAQSLGADQVITSEQLVANEFFRLIDNALPSFRDVEHLPAP
jgi:voltage-gated potassium channel Kch